jgi:hypothetical protein
VVTECNSNTSPRTAIDRSEFQPPRAIYTGCMSSIGSTTHRPACVFSTCSLPPPTLTRLIKLQDRDFLHCSLTQLDMLRQIQARTLQSLASNTYHSTTIGTLSKGVLHPLPQPTVTTLRPANARQFATETWEGQPPNIPGTGEPTSRLPGAGRSSAPGFGTGTTSSSSSPSAFGAGEPASQDYEELVVLEEAPTTSLFAPFWTLMLVTGMAGLAIGL